MLALPDLLVDVNRRVLPSSSEVSTTSSRDSSVSVSSPNYLGPLLRSSASKDSDSGRLECLPRPLYRGFRRPRAISCDVTLEVEVGQDLRKIADSFDKGVASQVREQSKPMKLHQKTEFYH